MVGYVGFCRAGSSQMSVVCRDHMEELRCVLAVVRHGDRTPKQKMKMKITQAGLSTPN